MRYLKEGNIVTDTKTGLMWHRTGSKEPMSWNEAYNHCSNLQTEGFTDWRLPTIGELITLIDFEQHNPASTFPDMKSSGYWSSTTYEGNTGLAWHVYFYSGYVNYYYKTYYYYVRAVRD